MVFKTPFRQLAEALEPWLNQVVVIGGWTHQPYRRHPAAQERDYPPLLTLDTNVAVPLTLPAGEPDIRGRLLAQWLYGRVSARRPATSNALPSG